MSPKRDSKAHNPSAGSAAPATAAGAPRDTPMEWIDQPTDKDVLLGRGSAQAWRPGNVNFHNILDQYMLPYQAVRTKKAKRAIIQEIYNIITWTHMGRFLDKEEAGDRYFEIEEEDAKEKIGYAIRYRKKRIMKAHADMERHAQSTGTSSNDEDYKTSASKRKQSAPRQTLPSPAAAAGTAGKKPKKQTMPQPSVAPKVPPPPPPAPAASPAAATAWPLQEEEAAAAFIQQQPIRVYPEVDIISDEELESVLGDSKMPPSMSPPFP